RQLRSRLGDLGYCSAHLRLAPLVCTGRDRRGSRAVVRALLLPVLRLVALDRCHVSPTRQATRALAGDRAAAGSLNVVPGAAPAAPSTPERPPVGCLLRLSAIRASSVCVFRRLPHPFVTCEGGVFYGKRNRQVVQRQQGLRLHHSR